MKKIHITSLLAVGALFMAACGGKSSSASNNAGGGVVPPEQQGTPVTVADAENILHDGAAKIESGEVVIPDVFTASASYLSTRNGASQGNSQVVSINKTAKRYYAGRSYSDGTSEEYWIYPANGGLYGYGVSGGRSQCVQLSESDFNYSLENALEQAEKNIEEVYDEVGYYVGQVDAMVAAGYAPVYSVSSLGAGHLYFTFSVTMPIDGAGTLGTMSAEGLFVNYLPVMLNASQISGTEVYSTQMTFAAGTETFALPAGVTCPAGSSQSSQPSSSQPSSSQPSTGNMTRDEAHALTQNYRDAGYTSCHMEGYMSTNGSRQTMSEDIDPQNLNNYRLSYGNFEETVSSQEQPTGTGSAVFNYDSDTGYLTISTDGEGSIQGTPVYVVTRAVYDANGYVVEMYAETQVTIEGQEYTVIESAVFTWGK